MATLLSIFGIIASIVLMKEREQIADLIGEGEWMRYFGGVYGFIIIVSVFIFFWSVATLTGTSQFFLTPVRWLMPYNQEAPVDPGFL